MGIKPILYDIYILRVGGYIEATNSYKCTGLGI